MDSLGVDDDNTGRGPDAGGSSGRDLESPGEKRSRSHPSGGGLFFDLSSDFDGSTSNGTGSSMKRTRPLGIAGSGRIVESDAEEELTPESFPIVEVEAIVDSLIDVADSDRERLIDGLRLNRERAATAQRRTKSAAECQLSIRSAPSGN